MTERDLKTRVVESFPKEFGLRAFPGRVFSISFGTSYVSGDEVQLCVVVRDANGMWQSFSRGTAAELRRELVELPKTAR